MESVGVVYYSHNVGNQEVLNLVIEQIKNNFNGEIISVTSKPIDFGKNIVYSNKTGALEYTEKILIGLEYSNANNVFLCEHDVLYHPSHFDFIPEKNDIFYYNTNLGKWKYPENFVVTMSHCKQVSGLCANRQLLINHYKLRLKKLIDNGLKPGDKMFMGGGFEPGTRGKLYERYTDKLPVEEWQSKFPNIDIKLRTSYTGSRGSPDRFYNKPTDWREGTLKDIEGGELLKKYYEIY